MSIALFAVLHSVALISPVRHARPEAVLQRTPPPRCNQFDDGMPSTPGWRPQQLDKLTNWAVNDKANRPIICEYKPDGVWLWSQYTGTVLSITTFPVLAIMILAVGVDVLAHAQSDIYWSLLRVPPSSDPFIQQLQGLNSLFEYQLTLATFILTFFTSQAYTVRPTRSNHCPIPCARVRVFLLKAVVRSRDPSIGGMSTSRLALSKAVSTTSASCLPSVPSAASAPARLATQISPKRPSAATARSRRGS